MRKKRNIKPTGDPGLSVIIPVHNEAANIEKTLEAIRKNIPVPHEIIVVYDSERDSTLPVLRRLGRQNKNLHYRKNTVQSGPSGALRTGFMLAKAPLVLVTMADLCDDLTQVPKLLSLAKKADIICPSRYTKNGRQELRPSPKVWIPRIAGFLLHLLTGLPTYDPTNSYKLYRKKVLDSMQLTSTVSFSVTLEIVAKAHLLGYQICEIPTIWRDRQHGKTNFNLSRSIVPYLKWFSLALLRNRILRFPNRVLQMLVGHK